MPNQQSPRCENERAEIVHTLCQNTAACRQQQEQQQGQEQQQERRRRRHHHHHRHRSCCLSYRCGLVGKSILDNRKVHVA